MQSGGSSYVSRTRLFPVLAAFSMELETDGFTVRINEHRAPTNPINGQPEPKRVINSRSFVSQDADLTVFIAKTQEGMTLLGSGSL